MAARQPKKPSGIQRRPPATDPEDRVIQMAGYADQLAEQQILDGTASSQVMIHYLKAGSIRDQLELEKIRQENLLLEQKRETMASQQRTEEMMAEVIASIRLYSGEGDDEEYE